MITNKNYFKKPFFFSLRYLRGGDEIIDPQMGSCDEISLIWSFKNKNMYIFIGLGAPKNGDEKKW